MVGPALVGDWVTVGAREDVGVVIGLEVIVGSIDVAGEIVGTGAALVGAATGLADTGARLAVGRLDIIVAGFIVLIIVGRVVMLIDGVGGRVLAIGGGEMTPVGEEDGKKDGASDRAGVAVGQPGQPGATVIGIREGRIDGVGRFTGGAVGAGKLIDIDCNGSQKSLSSRSKFLRP